MKNYSGGINPALIDDPVQRAFWQIVKEYLGENQRALANIVPPGNSPSLETIIREVVIEEPHFRHEWRANGPFQVGTMVDGGIVIPTAFNITSVRLFRATAGSAGSTVVDLNRNGTTLYTTTTKPTVTAAGGANQINATLPDIVSISGGDWLSIDIDSKEDGAPLDLVLMIEGA